MNKLHQVIIKKGLEKSIITHRLSTLFNHKFDQNQDSHFYFPSFNLSFYIYKISQLQGNQIDILNQLKLESNQLLKYLILDFDKDTSIQNINLFNDFQNYIPKTNGPKVLLVSQTFEVTDIILEILSHHTNEFEMEMEQLKDQTNSILLQNKSIKALLSIPNIKIDQCKLLLQKFETIERISIASIDELNLKTGFDSSFNQMIYDFFRKDII
ncbi:hypothetical protein DFA_00508 [Cavenderia fasciculata]|uniref:Uncharacterized protein n=1 Tax=Cavenderia fasciculata TaxID=261658 RepID=F4PSA1_CACFS|nr:uncharacterized protein DFA_00508 [Cavenderia fasciculata]EGG20647.1 hypothetical protein DFA_00508 [Cavenderia fasciculata]|eukprot:XP_004358497.1 hypothetical protein DFA_00508 [Cavenderia fasciculata]